MKITNKEDYLNTLLDQIRCKKVHKYIREEIEGHIEEQIEYNISRGMDKVKAEESAVRDMGDPVETGVSLDKVHRPQFSWAILVAVLVASIIGGYFQGVIACLDPDINYIILGIVIMVLVYFLDYTVIARFAKPICIFAMVILFRGLGSAGIDGCWFFEINNPIAQGGYFSFMPSILMFLYIPFFGAILYSYRGAGYGALIKSILWLIIPIVGTARWNLVPAWILAVVMLVQLSIAIIKGWYNVSKWISLVMVWIVCIIMIISDFFMLKGVIGYYYSNYDICSGSSMDMNEYVLNAITYNFGFIVTLLVVIMIVSVVIVGMVSIFKTKNQLGFIMGTGCMLVLFFNILLNVLANIGCFPFVYTFMPFVSDGGSHYVVSYALVGIILSIYKYKNIYPEHINKKTVKKLRQTA